MSLNEASVLRYHCEMTKFYPAATKALSWPTLKPGDVIDVVAPASACKKSELKNAVRFLRQLGYRPRVPKNIFSNRSKIFAQSDEQRLSQFSRALRAKDSKAIWCVRGGYGAVRLLPGLEKISLPRRAKIFLGYSDITTLHSWLNAKWKWPTVHGPLLDRFGRGTNRPKETREILGLLNGKVESIWFSGLKPMNSAASRRRRIRGGIVGGNLSVLLGSLGTPWQFLPRGHIVFFEDLGEKPHRLDRMLTQMQQAGFFKGAKAVIFGDVLFSDVKLKRLIDQDVLPRFAKSLKIPVMRGLPCGHGKTQRPLPFLTEAVLTTGRSGQLHVAAAARR